MHKGIAYIAYDPHRGGMKSRTSWWCVANVDKEVTRYYRWWIDRKVNPLKFDDKSLCQPSWDAHISIIRGEKPYPDKMHLWKKYQGKKFEFTYDHIGDFYAVGPRRGEAPGKFFIVDVDSPELLEIRKEFGFKTDWKLHLTFGRTYE